MARFRQEPVEKILGPRRAPNTAQPGAVGTQMLTRVQTMGPKYASAGKDPFPPNSGERGVRQLWHEVTVQGPSSDHPVIGVDRPCRSERQPGKS